MLRNFLQHVQIRLRSARRKRGYVRGNLSAQADKFCQVARPENTTIPMQARWACANSGFNSRVYIQVTAPEVTDLGCDGAGESQELSPALSVLSLETWRNNLTQLGCTGAKGRSAGRSRVREAQGAVWLPQTTVVLCQQLPSLCWWSSQGPIVPK